MIVAYVHDSLEVSVLQLVVAYMYALLNCSLLLRKCEKSPLQLGHLLLVVTICSSREGSPRISVRTLTTALVYRINMALTGMQTGEEEVFVRST